MTWEYIAGYFDGEGHVGLHPQKRGGYTRALTWFNSHLGSLEAMQGFMGCGKVRKARESKGGPVYTLSISNKREMLIALEHMLPHLIVKREAAEKLVDPLDEIEGVASYGKVAAVPTETILKMYNEDGMSQQEIADIVGVSPSAVNQAFRVRGLTSRVGRFTKGHKMSVETRAKMSATRRKLWADPEYRHRRAEKQARKKANKSAIPPAV